jgi:hypothetical protein
MGGIYMNTNKEIKNCGRPAGRRKTAKIEIAIEPEVKDEFMNICYEEGKTASTQLYQYIREYIKLYKKEEL